MTTEVRVDTLELAVFGNEKTKQKGLVERMGAVEETIKEIKDFKVLARGIAIGIGLNLVAIITGVVAILREVHGP